ncbi:RNA-directed DNA polymerase, eukaryota [Tanacetum coccineum]
MRGLMFLAKITSFDPSLLRNLWGTKNVDFVCLDSIGQSGGILLSWNSSSFAKEGSFSGSHLYGAYGVWQNLDVVVKEWGLCFLLVKLHVLMILSRAPGFMTYRWEVRGLLGSTKKAGITVDYGPRPFRVFDHRLKLDELNHLVKTSWSSNQYNGVADIVLKNKFKQLKLDIKAWCGKRKLADLENKARLNNILEKWELKAETCYISQEDIDAREEAIMEPLMLNQQDSMSLRQKSRIKWAVEGDENSRRRRGERWGVNRDLYPFRILNDSDTLGLISPFSEEEVKAAVWSCSGSKSPGPDGMNFNFIKRHWELVKDDFMMCFKQFEQSGRLARGVNPSFIILVPKTKDSLEISKYRPISLIGCIYKVISKALANRLAKVMHQIISPDQTAFISRRQILDGVLIANEVINYAIKWAWSWFSLRLTSRKLLIVLPGVSCLISWNKWGFSQKALQVMIMDAYDLGIFKGLSLQEDGASLSLLQYGDDALFLVNGVCLKDRFPHLFALESNKDCKISERWCQVNGVWSGAWNWRALPHGRGVDDLANLINVVGPLTLTEDSRDGWKWNLDPSNKFTVKRLSFLIDDKLLAPFALGRNHSWNNWIPRKVNVAVWRAANNRLPTMSCLSSRGVVVSSSLCPLCECAQESIEHTLCECPLLRTIWLKC